MKIYDSFLFFNELDLLEIRLNVLNDVVDYFVLVEASTTHQGAEKPFIYEENKERFSAFIDKIIHVKIEDTPDTYTGRPENIEDSIWNHILQTKAFNRFTEPHYGRIFYQRECKIRGLINCSDEDIILSSDVDEIPDPEILKRLNEFYDPEDSYTFVQMKLCFFLNQVLYSHIDNTAGNLIPSTEWRGTRMVSYKSIKTGSFNDLRNRNNTEIVDGGWHFSYVGGTGIVQEKRKASDGSGYSNAAYEGNLKVITLDETFPPYLLNNKDKYSHLFK
jgi:beta-1,4-mannosyl-glycoprotein beta-1,4-N-acetylglucosaminyltransferase